MATRRPPARPALATTWLRRIRFRHLEVLLAIERQGSLTAAAAVLGITQPAVSQWLADLEVAVGERLFVRGQRLKPTPFAAPLLAHALRIVNDAQRLDGEVQALRAGGTGRVRIGAMQVACASLVPGVVLALHAASPGLELSLVEDVAAGLWARFERNEIDLVVGRLDARALDSGLPRQRLFADPHRVICGPRHPLRTRRRVGWRDVARYPWILPTAGTPLRSAIEASFASAGVPMPATLLSSVSATANPILLDRSDALAVLSSASAALLQAQGLAQALPLTLVHDIGDVGMIWRDAEPGPALATVLAAFSEAAQALPARLTP